MDLCGVLSASENKQDADEVAGSTPLIEQWQLVMAQRRRGLQPVRRRLFPAATPEQRAEDGRKRQALLASERERLSDKWNMDFKTETPREGPIVWTKVNGGREKEEEERGDDDDDDENEGCMSGEERSSWGQGQTQASSVLTAALAITTNADDILSSAAASTVVTSSQLTVTSSSSAFTVVTPSRSVVSLHAQTPRKRRAKSMTGAIHTFDFV